MVDHALEPPALQPTLRGRFVPSSRFCAADPRWSPDGSKIAFLSERDGDIEIYVMDLDGLNQVRLTQRAAQDSEPAWSPDGTKIAFVSERDRDIEIYMMDADGSNPVNLTNNGAQDILPVWSFVR